ncbi:hypothetical protein G6F68_019863 [Rhizopus microsporus]|nr:hypothetical protein G6F68_019863 [Rhizopus microsporus]
MIRQDVEWDQTCTRVHSESDSSFMMGDGGAAMSNNSTIPSNNATMSMNQTMPQQGNSTTQGGDGGGGNPNSEESVSWEDAVNGTTTSSSISVKLWLQAIYQNTTNFYSQS